MKLIMKFGSRRPTFCSCLLKIYDGNRWSQNKSWTRWLILLKFKQVSSRHLHNVSHENHTWSYEETKYNFWSFIWKINEVLLEAKARRAFNAWACQTTIFLLVIFYFHSNVVHLRRRNRFKWRKQSLKI